MSSSRADNFSARSTHLWATHSALERPEVVAAIKRIQEAANLGKFHMYVKAGEMDIHTLEFLSILGYGTIRDSTNDVLITWN